MISAFALAESVADTEGSATVLHTNGAFRVLTKARRELAFGRTGYCKSPSTLLFRPAVP
jgi:hypothetical protein